MRPHAPRPGTRLGALSLFVLAAGAFALDWQPTRVRAELPAETSLSPLATRPPWRGTGSCSAVDCHGGVLGLGASGLKGSEYAAWVERDPHARAYGVLLEDRSRIIERNFRRLGPEEVAAPERDALCLDCHVHQDFDPALVDEDRLLLAEGTTKFDGVGCESCHGASGGWLAAHTTPAWKFLAPDVKARQYGFVDTDDLVARAERCIDCHLGRGNTEVNHDLIAAGHPRLTFEYSNLMAKYPKHWRPEAERGRGPDHEARTWLVGQALGARSALDLLADRADRVQKAGLSPAAPAWPEFADFDCMGCHQAIRADDPRPTSLLPDAKVGRPRFVPWNLVLADARSAADEGSGVPSTRPALDDLRSLMRVPYPDPGLVASRAREAARVEGRRAELAAWSSIDPIATLRRVGVLLEGPENPAAIGWDEAAQRYLALAVLHRSTGRSDPRVARSLDLLKSRLGIGRPAQGRPGTD